MSNDAPFKRGDIVEYTGEDEEIHTNSLIGAVGKVTGILDNFSVSVKWILPLDVRSKDKGYLHFRPGNLRKIGEVGDGEV